MNRTPSEAIQMLNSYVPKAVNNITNTANNAVKVANNAFNNVGNAVNNVVNNVAKTFNIGSNIGTNTGSNIINNSSKIKGIPWLLISIVVIFVTIVVLLSVFYDKIVSVLPSSIKDIFNKQSAAETPVMAPVTQSGSGDDRSSLGLSSMSADYSLSQEINKILPQKKEVFTIAENRYTYNDAAPLCKSMGAELATYDQVKNAFKKGADWCNYGWVKGQQAVYPTQQDTWEKLQSEPEDSRHMCGNVGLNGGYFDNPELRFGVTCYGDKPQQSEHDEQLIASKQLQPKTPSVIEFDRKVANFKANKNEIGLLPFNTEKDKWNSY